MVINMETYMKILLFIYYYVVLIFLSSQISDVSSATDTISIDQSLTVTGNQTIISKGEVYELGLFNPDIGSGNNDRVSLGIWYKGFYPQTYVWVANQKYLSLHEISADYLLMISNGNLILRDNNIGAIIWSTGVKSSKSKDVQAVLQSDGNLVLRDGNTSSAAVLWQSFDHPSNTWLPGAKLKLVNPLLTSWNTSTDPSAGRYTLEVDLSNKSLITVWNGSKSYWSSGPWDDRLRIYQRNPDTKLNVIFELNLDESYISYTMGTSDGYNVDYSNNINRIHLVIDVSGQLMLIISMDDFNSTVLWSQTENRCALYNYCGSFGICNETQKPQPCRCVPGFRQANYENSDSNDFSAGCIRETNLLCGKENNTFIPMENMKLATDPTTLVLKQEHADNLVTTCSSTCLANCSCNAYAYDGKNCMMWTKDVFNLQQLSYSMGHTFFLKVAASNITTALVNNTVAPVNNTVAPVNNTTAPSNQRKTKGKTIVLPVVLPSVLATALLVGFCCCISSNIRRKKSQNDKKQSKEILGGGIIDDDGEHMCYLNLHDIMAATNAFSEDNKLGEGGFGPVFKGKLPNGMDVAIKRLSRKSSQGLTEFKNEVVLIIKLQHKNLVRLLGYCVESDEKLLIYEYLSNKSLDVLLFDSEKGRDLDWETRMKIVNGTTRGLQYLHEDSRLRIIHRDLKASNILLDDEMNPKISDFGTARIFGCKQIDDNTQRIVGTFGYMSPEYALGGIISEKSDIYSFGVVLLEIISGKKATRFVHNDQKHSLIAYAWESWCETKGVSIIDEALCGSYSLKEMMRCVHIALLCVQDHPNDRPTISQIVYMLSNDNDLPSPKQPTFSNVLNGNQQLVSPDYVFSINEVTQTELEAR